MEQQLNTTTAIRDLADQITEVGETLADAIGTHIPIETNATRIGSLTEAIVFTGEAIQANARQTGNLASAIVEAGSDISAAIDRLADAVACLAPPE